MSRIDNGGGYRTIGHREIAIQQAEHNKERRIRAGGGLVALTLDEYSGHEIATQKITKVYQAPSDQRIYIEVTRAQAEALVSLAMVHLPGEKKFGPIILSLFRDGLIKKKDLKP